MGIQKLIDDQCPRVSVLEDMQQLAEWLREQEYYAVVDEEQQITCIVTVHDALRCPALQVIDHDMTKPLAHPDQQPAEVFLLMKSCRSAYLPVWDNGSFLGVVSLWSLTSYLLEQQSALPVGQD
jgi:predicted transcriptional regulator